MGLCHRCRRISIHASAKEATGVDDVHDLDFDISIHASAKEATTKLQQDIDYKSISIHASAKEATDIFCRYVCFYFYFNSRFREGSDYYGSQHGRKRKEFQFTLPRRKRQGKEG